MSRIPEEVAARIGPELSSIAQTVEDTARRVRALVDGVAAESSEGAPAELLGLERALEGAVRASDRLRRVLGS
jgi:hypothetical protein